MLKTVQQEETTMLSTFEKEKLCLEKIEKKIAELEKEFIRLEMSDEPKNTSTHKSQLKQLYGYAWAIERSFIKEETLDLILL